jgi:hypothetical protein
MKRDDIAGEIKGALENISTAAGYRTDPATVEVGEGDFERSLMFPALFVAAGDEEITEVMGGSGYLSRLRVRVVGLVNEPLSPQKGLQDLLADVADALGDEGYTRRDATTMESAVADEDALSPGGRFVMTLRVSYFSEMG